MMVMISVTRWLDYFSTFGLLQELNICPTASKKIKRRFLISAQSGHAEDDDRILLHHTVALKEIFYKQQTRLRGGSPGLVVMRGDSHSIGCGFESWRHILDGRDIFFTSICCKYCIVCLKRLKINEKEARVGKF